MRYTTIHLGILLGVGLSLGCAGVPDTYANTEDPCTGSGTSIVVEGDGLDHVAVRALLLRLELQGSCSKRGSAQI